MSKTVDWILAVILLFFCLILTPIILMAVFDDIEARRQIDNEVINFVDEIRDSGVVTNDMLEDFNLAINSYGPTMEFEIEHYAKVVNPDPAKGAGSTYTSYIATDNIRQYQTGDVVRVHAKVVGMTTAGKLLQTFLGYWNAPFEPSFAARVR